MKKVIRLSETDLMIIVKKVINEQSNPSNKLLFEFHKLMFVNGFKLTKFGEKDFKKIPTSSTGADFIAKNIVVNNSTVPGLQLYRGVSTLKYGGGIDNYVYIELDSRITKPFVHLYNRGEYKKFDLSTQLNELKSYIDNKIE
jgi:hypothetical protein